MWSKIDSTTFSYISETSTTTTLQVGSFSYIDTNKWVTIEPFTQNCEIRNIISVNSTTNQIIVSPSLKNIHTSGIIYIQSYPTWDVTLFGATPLIGNNSSPLVSSNNRDSINNAINDCNLNGGGIVYLPKGNYYVNKKSSIAGCIDLIGKSNINILGDGVSVTNIILDNDNYFESNVSIFLATNAINIRFANLSIDGNNLNATNLGNLSNCIDSNMGQRFLIENIEILNAPKNGIRISSFYNLDIKTCNIKYSKLNGILITGQTSEVNIIGNSFIENEQNDIYLNNNNYPSLNTNTITENIFTKYFQGTYSIFLDDTSNLNSISENFIISNNAFNGSNLYLENCRNIILNNNLIVSNTQNIPVLKISKNTESLNIQGNIIVNKGKNDYAINISDFKSEENSKYYTSKDMFISGNIIENGGAFISNASNINFTNNKIKRNSINANGLYYQISEDPTKYNLLNWGYLNIVSNQFIDITGNGITINCDNTNYKLTNILISDNIIQGLKNGVYITGSVAAASYASNRYTASVSGSQSTNILNSATHSFKNNDLVYFSNISGGGGLSSAQLNDGKWSPIYYIINSTSNSFQLSNSANGSAIDFTTDITYSVMNLYNDKNTLTDSKSSRNWISNMWSNYLVTIISGNSLGESYSILSNNSTNMLTIDGIWNTIPETNSTYQISRIVDSMKYGILIATSSNFYNDLIISSNNSINNATYSNIQISVDYLTEKTDYLQTWIVNSDPNSRIDAPNASIAIDKTKKFDNTYIKLGNLYKSGWILQSEIDKQLLISDTFDTTSINTINGRTPSNTIFNSNTNNWSVVSGTWSINNNRESYPIADSKAIAILSFTSSSLKADATLKSLFRSIQNSNTQVGLVFRYLDINNYWIFKFQNNNPTYSVSLDKFISGSLYNMTQSIVSFDNSNLFGLKVILKGDYISTFYNDFLISTTKDSQFSTQSKHGIISIGTSSTDYFCKNFKILI